MEAFSAYIRDIAVFLIFISFVDIIVPQKKYKEYINLMLAFILIFIVVSPLNSFLGFFGENNGSLFADETINYNRSLLQKEGAYYEEAQKAAVLAQYSDELLLQLKRMVESGGQFTFEQGEFSLDSTDESFGEIKTISVTVTEVAPKPTKKPFIRIEPVKVKVNKQEAQDETPPNVETSQIKDLKKSISDFYHILDEHIYVYITK